MKTTQQDKKTETIKIQINGIPVTLFFATEPNKEAADFIKKALINAYVVRTA
ncbi:hypothetical protein [Caproicibacter fermentans]|jgi:hypothetical protein|uniref:Uncharacterized protein n=1 Tax=Caproicibacter fermentans TaxID=2576756 RepID=A0A7G8T8L1_9FIRM|nr:hypothetical protein [Caproicibacter fermentans]MCI1951162.1 hypothetical protein [Clostridiales bacterium]MCI1960339.1 hypothetical protein [Clostridiales bacterium]MCI2020826.1 hypothetical protein [Clostridiales bacterium]MCI2025209.1 hypothetical protein [Clostridiales bacterium]QNK39952.1 hypothetical protein HCR03_14735 [Caproicibacter fermentans]